MGWREREIRSCSRSFEHLSDDDVALVYDEQMLKILVRAEQKPFESEDHLHASLRLRMRHGLTNVITRRRDTGELDEDHPDSELDPTACDAEAAALAPVIAEFLAPLTDRDRSVFRFH